MTLFSTDLSQQQIDGHAFPALVTGRGDLAAFIRSNKSEIDRQLAVSGTVLFRGFAVPSPQAFDQAIGAYGEDGFSYAESLSNAVRVNVTPRVFTANEAPPDVSIFLHHEMAQTPLYPSKLFFYCEIAPGSGGATPLCRSDVLMEKLQQRRPDLSQRFETLGLRYTHTMPDSPDRDSGQGRSWRDTLGVADRAAAETRLRDMGYDWTWVDDDALRVRTPVLDAVKTLPDGRKVFFNQLIAAFRGWQDKRNDPSKSITFGDGSMIDPHDMTEIIELSDALTYDLSWQTGDVALLDNFQVMHGRRPFKGKRRVLASLIS
ncbi:MAG: TauD/TfdA family dioxygenase [Henriciella sp.]|nr:TauD/TfdA family dioxygenase [Henriciella sp.]